MRKQKSKWLTKDIEVSPSSTKGVKKVCSTPLVMQKFAGQTDQNARLCEEKEFDKEVVDDQLIVQSTSTQEEVKSNNLVQHRKTRLRLICNFGGKIVIQQRKQHYIGGDT